MKRDTLGLAPPWPLSLKESPRRPSGATDSDQESAWFLRSRVLQLRMEVDPPHLRACGDGQNPRVGRPTAANAMSDPADGGWFHDHKGG